MAFMHTDSTMFCTYLPHTLFLLHPPALLISKHPMAALPSSFAQVLFCLISGVGHFCLSWMHVSFCLFHLLFQFCWFFVCLFISFLLWISIIVRQKLAERKIRNSKSKEKGGGERQALENLAVYTATSRDPLFLGLSFWSPVADSLMPPSTSRHHPSLTLIWGWWWWRKGSHPERGSKNAHT